MDRLHGEGFLEYFYRSADGLSLYARIYGAEHQGVPVLCLPGLSRNSRDFHQLALLLSANPGPARRVVTLDFRGRGRSDYDADKSRYTIAVEAGDVITACETLGIERALFIGTSRGGLVSHILAATRPDLLAGVILNDIGPVIELEGLREIQSYLGKAKHLPDWETASADLRSVHGAAFPALGPEDWRDLAHAIYRPDHDGLVADFDNAIAEQLAGADLTQPIPDLWAAYAGFAPVPLMVIRGVHSRLLSEDTVSEMAARHPALTVVRAEGQGHAPILHLGPLPDQILAFLSTARAEQA